MNDKGILAWDADSVTWDTITVDLTINFNVNANNSAYISATYPAVDDSYSTQLSNSGSITHTYTFSRETWDAAATIANNKFQVARGFTAVGDGATVPPFFRDVLAVITQNGYLDTTVSWDIAWAYNYTAVGPPVAGIPTNNSGTFNAYAGLSLDLSVAAPVAGERTPTWMGGVFSSNGSGGSNNDIGTTAYDFEGGTVIIPFPVWVGISADGAQIKIDSLKTVSGDLVDFGVTLSQDDTSAVSSYWTGLNYVTTSAIQDLTIEITTS